MSWCRPRPVRVALLGLALLVAVLWPRPLSAQQSGLEVIISRPGDGETLYAGPASLVSIVPITGRVTGPGVGPDDVSLRLEIWQEGELAGGLDGSVLEDGTYSFEVTLNPHGIHEGELNREAQCGGCHRVGKLALPTGEILLRVTASTSDGRLAFAEGRIKVDCSSTLVVPLRVVSANDPSLPVGPVTVLASTWIYEWRARSSRAVVGWDGTAGIFLEALAEVPTTHFLWIEPTVVDGALVQTVAPISVTLPAHAVSVPPVVIAVQRQLGTLAGQLVSDAAGSAEWPVVAISPDTGAAFTTQAGADGRFRFSDLPLARYVVSPDPEPLLAAGIVGDRTLVDLAHSLSMSVTLALRPARSGLLRGVVTDASGQPLPLAWVSLGPTGPTAPVNPPDGSYVLPGIPPGFQTVVAGAPGYYSRALCFHMGTGKAVEADFGLELAPDTRILPWGSGMLVLPAASRVAPGTGQKVELAEGWLWGQGGDGAPPLLAHAAGAEITIQNGTFALEQIMGRTGRLYVLSGSARVVLRAQAPAVQVVGGQMLPLDPSARPVPLLTSPAALDAMQPPGGPPLDARWDPRPLAQLRDLAARLLPGPPLAWYAGVLVMAAAAAWRLRQAARRGRPGG